MNTSDLKVNWAKRPEKLKEMWPQLTDEDLQYFEGEEEAMFAPCADADKRHARGNQCGVGNRGNLVHLGLNGDSSAL